jgi:hypothetical protein
MLPANRACLWRPRVERRCWGGTCLVCSTSGFRVRTTTGYMRKRMLMSWRDDWTRCNRVTAPPSARAKHSLVHPLALLHFRHAARTFPDERCCSPGRTQKTLSGRRCVQPVGPIQNDGRGVRRGGLGANGWCGSMTGKVVGRGATIDLIGGTLGRGPGHEIDYLFFRKRGAVSGCLFV